MKRFKFFVFYNLFLLRIFLYIIDVSFYLF